MTHFLPQTVPQPVEIVEFAHFLRERQNPRYSATLYDTTPLGECYPARLIYIERQAIIQTALESLSESPLHESGRYAVLD
jgi:hypothetical protein